MSTTCYKVLGADGESWFGGGGVWSLPTLNDDGTYTPGDWMPEIAEVIPCRSGYHYCVGEGELIHWLGPTIYIVEPGPVVALHENKHVTNAARLIRPVDTWNERTARLFAADCAERVLHLYERSYPNDKRPRAAIDASRAIANGHITPAELAAARYTARDAAWTAARDAAWAAPRAAAGAAAWAAVRDAGRDAVWDAVRAAARDAARAAAWAAARDVTRAAASDVASDAVWDTAWAAEQAWQADRLRFYLTGGEAA